MAKKKLTSQQRKVRKRASYIRSEYYKNIDAIAYLRGFIKVEAIKIPKNITKKSLEKVRKIYKESKRKIKELAGGGYLNEQTGEYFSKLPTKEEMYKEARKDQPWRTSRAKPMPAPPTFNPDLESINDLIDKIQSLNPRDDKISADKESKLTDAKQRMIMNIRNSMQKIGISETATLLAENAFMQRIANLEEKYAYQMVEEIDGGYNTSTDEGLIGLFNESVSEALDNV